MSEKLLDPLTLLAALQTEVAELRERVVVLENGKMQSTAPKRWMTAIETGAYLGISERAVYERIRRGRISPEAVRHVGRRVYVDQHELDASLVTSR